MNKKRNITPYNEPSKQVSLIIPTYNNQNTLETAILSASDSTYPLKEILVIDDGSTNQNIKSIVDSLKNTIETPVSYMRKANGGPSSARNMGLREATGEWIAFLDDDDTLLPGSIESKFNHLAMCHQTKNIIGIYGSFVWSSSNIIQPFEKSFNPISRNYIGIKGKVPGGAPAYIFKKHALIDIGGFDESLIFNEDFDLLLRLIKSGYDLVGTDEPGFIRNINELSLTRISKSNALIGNRLFLIKAFKYQLLANTEIIKRFIMNYLLSLKQLLISLITKKD